MKTDDQALTILFRKYLNFFMYVLCTYLYCNYIFPFQVPCTMEMIELLKRLRGNLLPNSLKKQKSASQSLSKRYKYMHLH